MMPVLRAAHEDALLLQSPSGGGGVACAPAGGGGGGGQISLAVLIEFIVQRVYHELTVLAELLPRKNDMERKIEIVQFAVRTRQLCVRLLALVKWSGSVSKVDKSAAIMAFLDKQSLLFVDTADKLSVMARHDLTAARLSMFHVPAAVEVLSTGGYSRLPLCVRERIVPARGVTATERASTLRRLNQIIEHRLVCSSVPPQMLQIRTWAGRVCMTVRDEFCVTLTLLGDAATMPWTLLDIDILVQDPEAGGGRSLVHPLQVRYLKQLVEHQLRGGGAGGCGDTATRPLHDVYQLLHAFCQSLQLEVLHAQLMQLCRRRLGQHVRLEQYRPGKLLVLSYWRRQRVPLLANQQAHQQVDDCANQRMIQVRTDGAAAVTAADGHVSSGLLVTHAPPLPACVESSSTGRQSNEATWTAVLSCGRLSIERLIVSTVQARCGAALTQLRRQLATELHISPTEMFSTSAPASLSVPLVLPCSACERLVVGVHAAQGTLTCHVPSQPRGDDDSTCEELASVLDCGDWLRASVLFQQLRFDVLLQRAHRTVEPLNASVHRNLPLRVPDSHRLSGLDGRRRLYVRLHRNTGCVVVLEVHENQQLPTQPHFVFCVAVVRACAVDEDISARARVPVAGGEDSRAAPSHKFLKVLSCIELNAFLSGQQQQQSLSCSEPAVGDTDQDQVETDVQSAKELMSGKRSQPFDASCVSKRPRRASCVDRLGIRQLARVVCLCEQQLPFAALCSELRRRGVIHSGIQTQSVSRLPYVRLLQLPSSASHPAINERHIQRVYDELLSAQVGLLMSDKHGTRWTLDCVFYGPALVGQDIGGTATQRRHASFVYPQPSDGQMTPVVERMLADWHRLTVVHGLLADYDEWCRQQRQTDGSWTSPVTVAVFNHRSATITYGPQRGASVRIDYCGETARFRLTLGVCRRSGAATNPHAIMLNHLEQLINKHRSLARLCVALDETYSPLVSIDKLSAVPRLGVRGDRPSEPVCNFIAVPQSLCLVRLFYRRVHCVCLQLHSDGMVEVRDGSFSALDRHRHLDELAPITALPAFLTQFSQSTTTTSTGAAANDALIDGLASPAVSAHEMDAASLHAAGVKTVGTAATLVGSPAAAVVAVRDGSRFAHPMTPGSSNPHTPASPAAGVPLAAQSPAAAFLAQPSPGGVAATAGAHMGHSPAAVMSPFAGPASHSPAVKQAATHGALYPPAASTAATVAAASQSTMLTHEAFDALCTRAPLPASVMNVTPEALIVSPLERFLGCVYARNHLRRTLDEEAVSNIVALACADAAVVAFRTECLQCRVRLEPQRMQTLHLAVQPHADSLDQQQQQWSAEQLHTLERFFDTKVAAPPYRQNSLKTFVRILNMQANVLRDFIRIMQLEELTTSSSTAAAATNWTVEWCTTSPPAVPALIPTGVVSLMNAGNKLLFFLQLTRRMPPVGAGGGWVGEPTRLVLPIVYNMPENSTQCADRKDAAPNQVTSLVNHMMRCSSDAAIQLGECSIFPAIRDVVHGLVLPSEQQQQLAVATGQDQHPAPPAMAVAQGHRGPFPQQQQQPPLAPGMRPMMQPQMGMPGNFPASSG